MSVAGSDSRCEASGESIPISVAASRIKNTGAVSDKREDSSSTAAGLARVGCKFWLRLASILSTRPWLAKAYISKKSDFIWQ